MSAIDNAIMFHKQGKFDRAEHEYETALAENIDDANALYLLGTLYLQTKRYGLAAQMLQLALILKPEAFEPWNNLGNCYKAVNKEADAKRCWEKSLSIQGRSDHEYADIWNNFATLYVNAGCPEEGVQYCEKSIALNPEHPDAHWNLALLNLEQGKYAEGFDLYEWGFKTKNRPVRNYGDKVTDWKGEHGKTVVVWGEQGIGDEILFSSIIPDLIKVSKHVIFDCHPRLVTLFKNSFPEASVYGTRKDDVIGWVHKHPELECKIAIADLAKYFRRSLKDFPNTSFLKANPERVEHYKKKLNKISSKPKIGISWSGGYVKTRKDYRSIPLEQWKPLFSEDYDFISLQYTPEAYNTVSEVEDKLDVSIRHWPFAVQNNDYHETAALVSALDLVITVNTAMHHLAGGLGKECWTLTPKAHAWRYYSPSLSKRTIPWYPSVRQWQQKELGDWDSIMQNVAISLKDREWK